jgi:CheY-like chemotaxis protein
VPTILVADDNSNIQKMVSLVFEEKGISVVAVGNGEAACRKVPEVKPDLVLADVFMPVRNGYEVCEFVKRDPLSAHTPVILLVGAFDPLDEKEARRVGADGVLKKPFVPPDPLIAMVGSLMQSSDKSVGELAYSAKKDQEVRIDSATTPQADPLPLATPSTPPPFVATTPTAPSVLEVESDSQDQDEYTYGMAPRDADDIGDGVSTEEPVATPTVHTSEIDDVEEEEPSSEWRRRREAMDYDIPAEESTSLVKQLVHEGKEIELERRDVAFGSSQQTDVADEDTTMSVAPEPIQEAPREWMNYLSPKDEEPEKVPSESAVHMDGASLPAYDGPTSTYTAEVHVESDDPISETLAASNQDSAEISPAPIWRDRSDTVVSDASDLGITPSAIETADSAQESVNHNLQKDVSTQTASTDKTEPAAFAESQTSATNDPTVNEATIDAIVSRVVEKLESEIHQILSHNSLRPLVEDVLHREKNKK